MIEEFKSSLPVAIKTYLEEQKFNDLHKAAILANDCKLTDRNTNPDSKVNIPGRVSSNSVDSTHRAKTCSRDQGTLDKNKSTLRSGPTCAYCKRGVHLISECWTLERKEKSNQPRSNVLVMTNDKKSSAPGINAKKAH